MCYKIEKKSTPYMKKTNLCFLSRLIFLCTLVMDVSGEDLQNGMNYAGFNQDHGNNFMP